MAVRIYKVILTMAEKRRVAMVEASTPSQAVKYLLKDMVEVSPASALEVASHMQKGGTIQNADGNVAAQSEPAAE